MVGEYVHDAGSEPHIDFVVRQLGCSMTYSSTIFQWVRG